MTRTAWFAVLLCLASASRIQAQTGSAGLPDAPLTTPVVVPNKPAVRFNKRIFWPMVGTLAASSIADVKTSYDAEQRFPDGAEFNDWLLGRRPSLARYSVTNLAIDGTIVLVSYKLLHSGHRWVRGVGWTLLAGQTMGRTSAAIYNSQH